MLIKDQKIEDFINHDFKFLKVKIGDNFLEIILNRPEKKNALNHLMIRELGICTDYANATKKIRVVIYKSIGDTFCSGLDLNELSDKNIFLADIFNKLHKPKIAVINGNVHAGGVLIVASCNYAICTNEVIMTLPEVKRGLFPFQVMDSLFRTMSEKKALDWCMRGYNLNAKQCKKMNIVQELCSIEEIDGILKKLIEEYSLASPNAIKNALKIFEEIYIDDNIIKRLNDALDNLKKSDDLIEGVSAFKEKRLPRWK